MSPRLDTEKSVSHRDKNRPDWTGLPAAYDQVEETAWDREISALGGHLMQSWRWGEFKRREGWRVERIRVAGPAGTGMVQVLFHPMGPVSTAFVPHGPLLSGDREVVLIELLSAIDVACRRHRTLSLGIEPTAALPFTKALDHSGFIESSNRFSPSRTVIVPLRDDQALLDQLHAGTRHKVRRAQRNGVEIRQVAPDEKGIATFYELLQDTARRQRFRINPPAHYANALHVFGTDAALLVASVAGVDVAALIPVRFGDEAIYLFGASASVQPIRGATALLQFAAMQWARSVGCARYDLWGIDDPSNLEPAEGSIDRSTKPECAEDNGLCRFKVGFGGEIVVYPRRIERQYHPHLIDGWRRLKGARALMRR
jgi:lipid II:glycine glycyltransferase (peptidoglycan interpeptide bridge formation enzyme)